MTVGENVNGWLFSAEIRNMLCNTLTEFTSITSMSSEVQVMKMIIYSCMVKLIEQ